MLKLQICKYNHTFLYSLEFIFFFGCNTVRIKCSSKYMRNFYLNNNFYEDERKSENLRYISF